MPRLRRGWSGPAQVKGCRGHEWTTILLWVTIWRQSVANIGQHWYKMLFAASRLILLCFALGLLFSPLCMQMLLTVLVLLAQFGNQQLNYLKPPWSHVPRTTTLNLPLLQEVSIALHNAIMFGGASAEVVSALIDRGADVNQPLKLPMFSMLQLVFGFLALKNRWNRTAVPRIAARLEVSLGVLSQLASWNEKKHNHQSDSNGFEVPCPHIRKGVPWCSKDFQRWCVWKACSQLSCQTLRANSDQQTTYLWLGAKADQMFPHDSVLTGY